jgi:hypothetical protein
LLRNDDGRGQWKDRQKLIKLHCEIQWISVQQN